MGNSYCSPYEFRRAIVSLHYAEHPLSDQRHSNDELKSFWRTLFCSRMDAEEHASFWTAEDVRLLRMYHPDRLATVLLAAMSQLEAFLCLGGVDRDDVNRHDEANMAEMYMQRTQRSSEPAGTPLDLTAAENALRLISGALPYCFEPMDALRGVLCADAEEAGRDAHNIVITSQRTRTQMGVAERRESPYAEDFAYHFFVCGSKCVRVCSTPKAAEEPKEEEEEVTLSPGTRLVEQLARLFFTFGQLASDTWQQEKSAIEPEWRILHRIERKCGHMFPVGINDSRDLLENGVVPLAPTVEERRAEALRALVLALSAPNFTASYPHSKSIPHNMTSRDNESTSNSNNSDRNRAARSNEKDADDASQLSIRRHEKVISTMTWSLFNSHQRPLSAILCVSLLHIVRCYPSRPPANSASVAAWVKGFFLSEAHKSVLCHALSLLALGLYTGPSVKIDSEASNSVPNVFWHCFSAALDMEEASLSSTPDSCNITTNSVNESHASNHTNDSGHADMYVTEFLSSILLLLDFPANGSLSADSSKNSVPCAPMVLHILLWLLQRDPCATSRYIFARGKGVGSVWLLALIRNLLVSSASASGRVGEGQMTLLCFLAFANCPSFLRFLAQSLPSEISASREVLPDGEMDGSKFMQKLRTAMPILPSNCIIMQSDRDDSNDTLNSWDTLCIQTYGDILVLALCYVLSPAAPRWFCRLYRTAVEVLHAVHMCFPDTRAHPANSFLRDVLSPHVSLEMVSSFSHLSSIRVLQGDVEAQRACQQMAVTLFYVIHSLLEYVAPTHHVNECSSPSSVEWTLRQKGHDALVPLLLTLAVPEGGVFDLTRLLEEFHAEKPHTHPPRSPTTRRTSVDSFTNPFSIPNAPSVSHDGLDRQHALGSLSVCTSLMALLRMASTVRGALQRFDHSASKRGVAVSVRDSISSAPDGEEKEEVSLSKWPRRGRHVDPSNLSAETAGEKGRREVSRVVLQAAWEFRTHASREEMDAALTKHTVRRVVMGGTAVGRWFMAQLWRQVHMFNLKIPMFDYRTTVMVN